MTKCKVDAYGSHCWIYKTIIIFNEKLGLASYCSQCENIKFEPKEMETNNTN